MNILISIGNSDDKLSQQEWSRFIADVRCLVRRTVQQAVMLPAAVHGEWFSASDSPWQNANWLIELVGDGLPYRQLRRELRQAVHEVSAGLDCVDGGRSRVPVCRKLTGTPWCCILRIDRQRHQGGTP